MSGERRARSKEKNKPTRTKLFALCSMLHAPCSMLQALRSMLFASPYPLEPPMQPITHIHDGMTRRGYVTERKFQHPAVRFTYRPMLIQNRAVLFRQISECKDPRKEQEYAARCIAAQVGEWDLIDDFGKSVPLTSAAVLRLEPNLFNRLFEIVTGTRVTEEDPQWTDDERRERDEQELERALSGCGPVEEAEAQVKNSAAG
jgi:hypothetical protein